MTGPPAAPYNRDLPPTLDRLVAAYEDLSSKRFQILADFESPEQGTLFHVEPAGSVSAARISTERARVETGVGSLKMTITDSRQRVVAADSPESQWTLVRDWTKYHLLVMSVFSPRKLGGFNVTIRSGTNAPLSYTIPRLMLNPGWNLLRIDLGDLAEQVNLADVREMQFGCDPLESPVDLYLDDLIITDNSREVFGSPQAAPGQMYVMSQGRRLAIGSAGRFEVVFARGQLRQWYDVAADSAKLHNLLGRGALGPFPVVLPADGSENVVLEDPAQWSGLGIAAEVFQTLLEANPLYARIQGQLRFGTIDSPPDDTSPAHRWVYTIYRDGRIYVECTGAASGLNFQPAGVGMAFTCDGGAGFTRLIAPLDPADAPPPSTRPASQPVLPAKPARYALFHRDARGAADLLIAPSTPMPARGLDSREDARTGVLWVLPEVQGSFSFAALLRVWPADIDAAAQADPLAADYQQPLPIGLEIGRLTRTDPGDFNGDGFSEGRGHYVLQLDGSMAKARIPGQSRMRFAPVLQVIEAAGLDVWAYLDGRQLKESQRDHDGNVTFLIPETLSRESLLEITSRTRETAPAAPKENQP